MYETSGDLLSCPSVFECDSVSASLRCFIYIYLLSRENCAVSNLRGKPTTRTLTHTARHLMNEPCGWHWHPSTLNPRHIVEAP